MRYIAKDFDIQSLGGWGFFCEWMNKFYVGSPWNFGYKCPKCDMEDFEIINNIQIQGNCPKCGYLLVPFFSQERARKYFLRDGFIGKMVMTVNHDPVGWVLGFIEDLNDYNDVLQHKKVFNISYICVLPKYRNKGVVEKIRRFLVYMFITKNLLRKIYPGKIFVNFILNSPIILGYTHILSEIKKRRIKSITAKVHKDANKLEKIATILGFQKLVYWNKDPNKNIWLKNINVK